MSSLSSMLKRNINHENDFLTVLYILQIISNLLLSILACFGYLDVLLSCLKLQCLTLKLQFAAVVILYSFFQTCH